MSTRGRQRELFVMCAVVGVGNLLALDLYFAPAAIAESETRDTPAPTSSAPTPGGAPDAGLALPPRIVIPAPARVPTIVARFDRASKEPTDESAIRALATAMIEDHDVRIVLEGHSDMRGGDDYNHAISLERANWVKARVVALGVNGDRIETVGLGATHPLRSDEGEGPSVNRRVEVRWLGGTTIAAPSSSVAPKRVPPKEPSPLPRGKASATPTPDASAERPKSRSSDAAIEASPLESPPLGDN